MAPNSAPEVRFYGAESDELFTGYAAAFVAQFGCHTKPPEAAEYPIVGRMLRGRQPQDFEMLSDNPARRVVFLTDGAALADMIGLDGREILQLIGYPEAYIDELVAQGTQFQLALLPAAEAMLATWEATLQLVAGAYPEWRQRIEVAKADLAALSYDEIMAQGGDGAAVRTFLRETMNMNALFTGTGLIQTEVSSDSVSTHHEYVSRNQALADYAAHCLISVPVV